VAPSQPKNGIAKKNEKAQTTHLISLQPMKFVNHTAKGQNPICKI
jgi:hypothetical protein